LKQDGTCRKNFRQTTWLFADIFGRQFSAPRDTRERFIYRSLEIGWDLLKELPKNELKRVKGEHIEKYGNRND